MPTKLIRSVRIGKTKTAGNLFLAPLAGTSEHVFRALCHDNGAAFSTTELVSARGMRYDPKLTRSYPYLYIDPAREGPCAIQLFGFDPDDFAYAIERILVHPKLSKLAALDINMGCPVPKVVKTGAGAALMRSPERARAIIRRAVDLCRPAGVPVTAKIRAGWDESDINAAEIATICCDEGISAITIHARTRAQMYTGQADWTYIKMVVESCQAYKVPVFGNGDITDAASVASMLRTTHADAAVIGRAARGNPWLFSQIKAGLLGQNDRLPTRQEVCQTVMTHLEGLAETLGEARAVQRMKGSLSHYLKGYPNASQYKEKAMQATLINDVRMVFERWATEPADPA